MKSLFRSIVLLSVILAPVSCTKNVETQDVATPVDFTHVNITDSFWKHRIDINANVTIPHSIKKCYDEGRVDNFLFASGAKEGKFQGVWGFNDSDVYKVLEGMAFSYSVNKDPQLLGQMDTLISYIGAAQQPDGYLYTPYTLRCRDYADVMCTYDKEPYDHLVNSHEFYNMGHMYEAAAAHYIATGQSNFLDIALKSANHIYDTFGPGKREAIPGHEEIEIGLMKLYDITNDSRYLELAKLFMDRRGHGLLDANPYYQDQLPVVDQREALGHAVRANYLFTAMTRYATISHDPAYTAAVDSLWNNVVGKKIYLTGGLGVKYDGEAYGANYELPNFSYAETCASIAGVFWARNMFMLHSDAQYIDVLERILYNGLISGISLDGTKFFYPNVLSNENAGDFNKGNSGRAEWFDCSCCPTNDVRFLSSLPGYVYAVKGNEIYVNMYVADNAKFDVNGHEVAISQETDYPWDGHIEIKTGTAGKYDLMLRIPGWVRNEPIPGGLYRYADSKQNSWMVAVNGDSMEGQIENGYFRISRNWKEGDVVTLDLEMNPRTVVASDKVEADRGKVAFERGPIVYCAESTDNPEMNVFTESVNRDPSVAISSLDIDGNDMYTLVLNDSLTLIPYYAWNHRGASDMTVWLNEKN